MISYFFALKTPTTTGLLIYSQSSKACVLGVSFGDYEKIIDKIEVSETPDNRIIVDFRPAQRAALKL